MTASPSHRSEAGLTLIELILSIALLAIISLTGFTVIQGASRIAAESTAKAELSKMGRNALALVSRC